ncbi:MAG: peptide chain release factor N(5)-glutamine methyltransferase [Sumerlaeia bacterium]
MKPTAPLTIGDVIAKSAQYLTRHGADSPRLDAELLLGKVLGCDRLRLYMDWKKPLIELELAAYRELIRQRAQDRIPVARLLGKKEFYSRDFLLENAFVPRPETEGLVERALDLLSSEKALQPETGNAPYVFEIGTGSGCIVVTMAAENGAPHYIASDVDPKALATARRNAAKHDVESRIEFREGPLLAGFEGSLHLIVSNPPYIPASQIPGLPPEVRVHDPMAALDGGGDDGLDIARQIVHLAKKHLVPGGCLVMELGEDQEPGIVEVFRLAGCFESAHMDRDLAGKPRYAFARKKV